MTDSELSRTLKLQGFDVQTIESELEGQQKWVCLLSRHNQSQGYFGSTKEKALAKALKMADRFRGCGLPTH